MTVERILKKKGTHAPVVAPDVKIADVIDALESEEVGALVVSTDGLTIDGIISERDIVRGLQRFGPSVLNHSVRDLMTENVVTCTADDPVAGVMAIMDHRNIRHVPVVDDGALAGIVSIRDIIKLRLDEVQSEANAMREYISYGR
jgi:CBS domain-containing protein